MLSDILFSIKTFEMYLGAKGIEAQISLQKAVSWSWVRLYWFVCHLQGHYLCHLM